MRWKALFRRRQLEKELEDEIRSHLTMEAQQRIERGDSAEDARINAKKILEMSR